MGHQISRSGHAAENRWRLRHIYHVRSPAYLLDEVKSGRGGSVEALRRASGRGCCGCLQGPAISCPAPLLSGWTDGRGAWGRAFPGFWGHKPAGTDGFVGGWTIRLGGFGMRSPRPLRPDACLNSPRLSKVQARSVLSTGRVLSTLTGGCGTHPSAEGYLAAGRTGQ